jgi:hypothetical protein
MGLRFQKRISILPWLRVNLSKSGVSASVGPRGADVNIGPHGLSTNAGIPGTGLSYRSKLGTHASWLGVALLVGALAFWAGRHIGGRADTPPPTPAATAQVAHAPAPAKPAHPVSLKARIAALSPGTVYVRRGGSVVRDDARSSATVLKHEAKGAAVTLLEKRDDGWARIKDGAVTGWMRASVLGSEAP